MGLPINFDDPTSVQSSINAAADHAKNNANLQYGKLDILVNAAGWRQWQFYTSFITICALSRQE